MDRGFEVVEAAIEELGRACSRVQGVIGLSCDDCYCVRTSRVNYSEPVCGVISLWPRGG